MISFDEMMCKSFPPSSRKLNKGYKLHADNHEYGETLPHVVIKVGGRLSGES